jgi:hypothetical protein
MPRQGRRKLKVPDSARAATPQRERRRVAAPVDYPDAPPTASRRWLHAAIQFTIAAIIFRFAGEFRLMDADEGHFLSAIRMVQDGFAPCQDFFYQQTPLFPYPYAWAMSLFGYGYDTCWWVSILCGAALATVTGVYFTERSRSTAAGWMGWFLIVSNAQILFWTPVVKNHAMPLMFGAVALWAASRRPATARGGLGWGALCGFASLCAVGMRLPAAPFAAWAGMWIGARAVLGARNTRRAAWWGVLGYWIGVLPPALLALGSVFPDTWVFVFDVIGFHEMRSGSQGTWGTWRTVSRELGIMAQQAQFPLMLVAAGVAAGWCLIRLIVRWRGVADDEPNRPRPRAPEIALLLGGVASAISALLPQQTFHQYFMVPLLFLIFATAPLFAAAWFARNGRQIWRMTALIGLVIYAFSYLPPTEHVGHGRMMFANHCERVFENCWSHENVRAMAGALAQNTAPDDVVFSTWQGFTFMARRPDIRGNENFNGRTIVHKVSKEERERLKLVSNAELTAMIREGVPKAVVVGFFCGPSAGRPFYHQQIYRIPRRDFRPAASLLKNYRPLLVPNQGYHQLWIRK